MKKLIVSLLVGVITSQTLLFAASIEQQKKELEESLTSIFKYKNTKNIKDMYTDELKVLEAQYARNKQIEDFQKRQRPDVIQTPVFTTPFTSITSTEWDERITEYANAIAVTKIPRKNNTELIFHFPQLNTRIFNLLERYRIEVPSIQVASVLLSSGKVLPIDKSISPNNIGQSIMVENNGESILKINLTMNYQIPNDNIKTVLSTKTPSLNGMTLLPAFPNVVLLRLTANNAKAIIHIDAEDKNGNTLATKSTEKVTNINELAIQATRIELLKGLLKKIDDNKIRLPKDATNYMLDNSDKYLEFLSNPTRELSKVFSGEIHQVIIYTTEDPMTKHMEFSLY